MNSPTRSRVARKRDVLLQAQASFLSGIAQAMESMKNADRMRARHRKLVFRANHRGMKELDVILGRFAQAHVAGLNRKELDQFEHILDVPDPDLYAWIMGTADVDEDHDNAVFSRLRSFRMRPEDYSAT